MNTVAGSCGVNWFRGSRGKTGCGGARCSFTTKRDSHGSSHYRWEVAYTNVNHNSCFGASPISILRRLVIASFSPNWIQTKNFYVVRKGRIPGIYDIWEDCKSQVQGFHDNEYKKFSSGIEAKEYLAAHGINSTRYITKKALLKDPKHGQDAYKNQYLLQHFLSQRNLLPRPLNQKDPGRSLVQQSLMRNCLRPLQQ